MASPVQVKALTNKPFEIPSLSPKGRAILIAIATIMAIGLVVSGLMNAPWLITLGFFTLALIALFPLDRRIENERQTHLGKNLLCI